MSGKVRVGCARTPRPMPAARRLRWWGAAVVAGASLLAHALPGAGPSPTPASLPGSEAHVYRELPGEPLRLHVFRPAEWQPGDQRPAFVWFFGGGWLRGSPTQSAGWARRASAVGLVGVAVDYRTRERFGTDATAAVADARRALRWVQDHATEFGVDPARVIVGGSSAGAHLALWAAIPTAPVGASADDSPRLPPAALLLVSAPADTSRATGIGAERFGPDPDAYSPLQHLPATLPPTLLIHGDADRTVPYRYALALHEALVTRGAQVEFVTVPGGTHGFSRDLPEWKARVPQLQLQFLRQLGLLAEPPAEPPSPSFP